MLKIIKLFTIPKIQHNISMWLLLASFRWSTLFEAQSASKALFPQRFVFQLLQNWTAGSEVCYWQTMLIYYHYLVNFQNTLYLVLFWLVIQFYYSQNNLHSDSNLSDELLPVHYCHHDHHCQALAVL